MDRYDHVINDILEQSEDGVLRWRSVAPSRYENVLLNVDRVIRAYRTDYALGDENYELVFVDKKVDHLDEETGWMSARGGTSEVLILDAEGEVALRLYEGAVDQNDLARLAGLIEGRNDRAKGFFAGLSRKARPTGRGED